MSVTFQKAERKNIGLFLMVAGGTGSGKTWTGMELSKGLAGGQRFAVCDTERGRARMYADTFDFDAFDLVAPFSPDRYLEVVLAAEAQGYPVLMIDSMSHEWESEGGLLDWHERLMGGQQSKNLSAWIEPKMAHRRFVNRLLQANMHVVMCFRAAERVEAERGSDGKMKIVPKKSLTGLDGWMPITEKNLPFEATVSVMLMAQKPGFPQPIKLPEPLKTMIPLNRPLSADTGAALAQWAAGGSPGGSNGRRRSSKASKLTTELLGLADEMGRKDEVAEAVNRHRQGMASDPERHEAWLEKQLERARDAQQQLASVGSEASE